MNKIVAKVNNERLKKWKENQAEICVIDSNRIDIVENVHKNGIRYIKIDKFIDKFEDEEIINKNIIVKYNINNDKYELIMGLKWLMIAKELNKSINCIVVNDIYTHKKLIEEIGILGYYFQVPEGTDDIIKLEDIVIPNTFKDSHPRGYKINQYTRYFNKHKCLDKPILVEKGIVNGQEYIKLVDQYIRYLIFKNKGIKNIPVKYVK